MERRRYRWSHPGRHLFSGFVFITIGLIFLLGNLGFVNVALILRFWPIILIAMGVMKLVESQDEFRRGSGIFWIVIGILLLLGSLDILRFALHVFWPIALIGLGCLMLWRSVLMKRERASWVRDDSGRGAGPGAGAASYAAADDFHEEPATSSNSILSATAILGGVARRNNCQDFRGGDATAIMGGCEIDLRPAGITPPHEAVIEVFAMWGGIVIKVPPDWTVIAKVDPILGGYEDKTTPPKDETKRFVIRGSVVMGGIEVRN
jgi:predicted membrane protein